MEGGVIWSQWWAMCQIEALTWGPFFTDRLYQLLTTVQSPYRNSLYKNIRAIKYGIGGVILGVHHPSYKNNCFRGI